MLRSVLTAICLQGALAQGPTCGDLKDFYGQEQCCGSPSKQISGEMPSSFCTAPTGVCECQRMVKSMAGLNGVMFPVDFCDHMKHLKPVGFRSAPICEANDAGATASLLVDGQAGDTNFPFGDIKVLATVGEVNPNTGAMLTGVPDGMGAYLEGSNTVRVMYQSESYGPIHRQETFPFFVNEPSHVGITGSHIHYIDLDRDLLAQYFDSNAPANAMHMVKDSGEAVQKMYNLQRNLVGKRTSEANATHSMDSCVNTTGHWIVNTVPAKADWILMSLCAAHLEEKHQWGDGIGVEDNLFITNEEWHSYLADSTGIIGLPAHVLDIKKNTLWATSAFGTGGFEKIVEVSTGTTDFVAFAPSGYNGAFGGAYPAVVASRNAAYSRTDGNPYVWTQNIAPARLYIGKKNTDKDGNADTDDFLARNGFEFGAMYGFATDCSTGPGAENRDPWHKNTAQPGDQVVGAFYKLRWSNQPGQVKDFVHDLAWEFQDAPEGAPAGWCFWNANGKDNAGCKTEHNSPDPRGGLRVLQGSTCGYFGIYDYSDLSNLLAGGQFPDSIPANYTVLQPESDIRSMVELGGQGQYADGQNATVMPDKGQNPGKATFEDIDGLEWIAAKGGDDYIIIQEDGGNDFGERTFLAKVGTPMTYYFIAMSGGPLNSRQVAGVSAVEGAHKYAASHEFSGAVDLSAFLAKSGSGYSLTPDHGMGKRRGLEAETAINDKLIGMGLQAHSNWGGWTTSFNPDAAGQLLIYKPELP